MKSFVAAFAALALAGCAGGPAVRAPDLPPLSASIAQPCPPAQALADTSIGALVQADAALAAQYARCRAKHAAAVKAYENARKGGKKGKK